MDELFRDEYKAVTDKLVNIQNCITEYTKMFLTAGTIFLGVVSLPAKGLIGGDMPTKGASGGGDRTILSALDWLAISPDNGWSLIALLYIILGFIMVIFHKFNSHNRMAGYLRAMEMEIVVGDSKRHAAPGVVLGPVDKQYGARSITDIRLYELSLSYEISTRFRRDFLQSAIATDMPSVARMRLEHACCVYHMRHRSDARIWISDIVHVITGFIATAACGLYMIIRAPIKKYPSKSWTYPYHVVFSYFATSAIVSAIWVKCFSYYLYCDQSNIYCRQPNVYAQFVALLFLLTAWTGMFYRLYRLCGDCGDRTVDFYTCQFVVARWEMLKAVGISVVHQPVYLETKFRPSGILHNKHCPYRPHNNSCPCFTRKT